MGEDPGLPGAGAGQHEQRPLAVAHGLALGFVEPREQPLGTIRADLGRRRVGGASPSRCWDCPIQLEGPSPSIARGSAGAWRTYLAAGRRTTGAGAQLALLAAAIAAVELGEASLELGDPLREGLDRLRDRVRQADPVRIGALDEQYDGSR